MKIRIIVLNVVLATVIPGAAVLAQVSGGSFTTPVSARGRSLTTPGSSYRSGLVPSRKNSLGRDQNLVVTGNVPGGRHFRGIVPYSSVNSLSASTDIGVTSSVESFIRRSSGLPYIDSDPSLVQPYYLPRQTLTSLVRGNTSGLVRPRIQFPGGTGKFAISKAKPLKPVDTSKIYQPRSMLSMSTAELERLSGRDMLSETFGIDTDGLLRNSLRAGLPIIEEETPIRPATTEDAALKETIDEPLTPARPLEPTVTLTTPTKELRELLEKDLQRRLELRAEVVEEEDRADEKEQRRDTTQAEQAAEDQPAEDKGKYRMKLPEKRRLPEVDHKKAQAILGQYKNYAELAEARFNEFVERGNAFMKEGRYYKAIDSYILATVWNSRDGKVNLYRGIAHFAAGEYISASLFVRRAILFSPEIASGRIDLAGILPDRDLTDDRLVEATSLQKRSDSAEIAFLLAYLYHQQDRPDEAKQFIADARSGLPESKAAELLEKAIDAAAKK